MTGTDEMTTPDTSSRTCVADLLAATRARAAGLWRIEGEALRQVAFVPSPGLPFEVATRFDEATRLVPLSRTDLGIVRAAVERDVVVSLAEALSADSGSGYWLRDFGAERSVAVPLRTEHGDVWAVLSLALPSESPLDDDSASALARAYGHSLNA